MSKFHQPERCSFSGVISRLTTGSVEVFMAFSNCYAKALYGLSVSTKRTIDIRALIYDLLLRSYLCSMMISAVRVQCLLASYSSFDYSVPPNFYLTLHFVKLLEHRSSIFRIRFKHSKSGTDCFICQCYRSTFLTSTYY